MHKNNFNFKIIKKDPHSHARAGEIETPHGIIKTPIFMPVGTQATVKALTPQHLKDLKAQIILANTYHLTLRPGLDVIKASQGLHDFMQWPHPILTDSGGYQVFSLGKQCTIHDHGVTFQSHLNGDTLHFTPENVIDKQRIFKSDIMMPLDVCSPYPCTKTNANTDMQRTHKWAKTAYEHWQKAPNNQWLFGIVQGSTYPDLRQESVDYLTQLDFPGYAIGGVSVGEPKEDLEALITSVTPTLPEHKPRYIMGIGYPENLDHAIKQGADMFDCVLPSRLARHGQVFMGHSRANIKQEKFKEDLTPIDTTCTCYTCQHFSRAYLRHLFIAGEILSSTLLTIHNIHHLISRTQQIRNAILET